MKTVFAILAVLVVANVAFAQSQQTGEGVVIRQNRVVQGPEGGPPPPPNADFVFIASESFGGKVVKGAPYSAEAVTESVQLLGDGNRIVNKFTSTVYRDSEGRTRRDQTLKGLSGLGNGNEPLQTIFINDPVAGVTYSLDSRTHIARKSTPFKFEFTQRAGVAGADVEGRHFEFKVGPGVETGANVIMTAPVQGPPPPPGTRVAITQTEQLSMGAGAGASTFVFRTTGGPNANEKKEDLGKQMIEGVEAEGTRTTVTIPAGEVGNERPIEIVSERWYSPELQLLVMTRHSDPRTGETTYKLTNINRSEPAKSMFEVPADYTIKEGLPARAPMPARVKKLANPE
ncbi:MAG TPA: hypothetical protein VFZ22_18490 [Pyrinomonadaceae bacterium]|nr:hypothetical protein [Pyrinomonadaceae bacterium]